MKNGEADVTRRAKVVSLPMLAAQCRMDPAFLLSAGSSPCR
jgi:hypothetical protein